jgi:TM2 domain-containing membrane protein YozV
MLNAMTEPQFGGREDWTSSAPPPPPGYSPQPPGHPPQAPGYPPQAPGYPPPQYAPPPPVGAYYDPSAPYGRHPQTGEPLSEKSKVVGGLLQLIGLFGLVGIGRIYLGYTGLGIAQLLIGLVTCGIGAVIWGIIDAILILSDKVRDPQGRPLRDGT